MSDRLDIFLVRARSEAWMLEYSTSSCSWFVGHATSCAYQDGESDCLSLWLADCAADESVLTHEGRD